MPRRRRKTSVAHVDGEEGNACSKTSKTGIVLSPYTSPRGASKFDHDLPEPCTNHMGRSSQAQKTQRNGKTTSFSQHGDTVKGVRGRSSVSGRPSTKSQIFAELPQLKGADAEVNLNNEEENCIRGYNIIDVPKIVDTNFTSNKTTLTKQKDGIFKAKLSSDDVKISNQTASQCKL